jgi:hypothetical protein
VLRKQKGQSFVEFALILPLLLLLILGVIEAARVIWAFITVQQAARESTRYAVTGRPYLNSNSSISSQQNICFGTATEPNPITDVGIQPWICAPQDRVKAIKLQALSHLQNLAYSTVCDQPNEYLGLGGNTCNQEPGAIGVLVQGQVTTETITGTLIVAPDPVIDHPGQQGLNVQISTFYNLQMITPIFDAIMGGTYVRLEGRTQLQNEGLDAAAGIEPPPGINPPPTPEEGEGGDFIPSAKIWSVSGYTDIQQSDSLKVHLEDHSTGFYDIFLEPVGGGTQYKICANIPTDVSDRTNPDPDCSLASAGVPPGLFELYSTVKDSTAPRIATAPDEVEVTSGGAPVIQITDGFIWAANETTQLTLLFHELGGGITYDVKLYDPGDTMELQTITTGHTGSSVDKINWTPPSIGDICKAGTPDWCTIRSFKNGSTLAAELKVKVNNPKIVLSGGLGPYARGEAVYMFLRSHTPGRAYSIKIPGPTDDDIYPTSDTNAVGDTTQPVLWLIPNECGFGTGWPDGSYTLTSHPLGETTTPAIATLTPVQLQTPAAPFLSIEGGTTWSAGSSINIRVHQHKENEKHYLEFDGDRIPTETDDDTFVTGSCGDHIQTYTIPIETIAGTYTIASFNITGTQQATLDVNVLATPIIQVLEGPKVLPGQTITVKLASHQPNFSYNVFYADKFIQSLLTEPDGSQMFTYDLDNLPTTPPPDLSNPANYGIPYILNSRTVVPPETEVASTTLTIEVADLAVTQVNVAPVAPLSSTVPISIVVQNLKPITINGYVDVDLYTLQHPDPDPIGPSYLAGYNFPGDLKFWKNGVGPNETFVINHTISATQLGLNTIYGYADTSNRVFESEGVGQVANPNNIGNSPMLVNCATTTSSDSFSTDYAQGAAIPGWTVQTWGNADQGFKTQVTGGQLLLNSDGSGNHEPDDTDRGYLFAYRSNTFTSTYGLDAQVKIVDVDLSGGSSGSYAKGGIEIRSSLASNGSKVMWGVAKNNGDTSVPRQIVHAAFRVSGNDVEWVGGSSFWQGHQVDLPTQGPIWLRVWRDPGDGSFKFYYKFHNISGAPPALDNDAAQATYWGNPVQSITVSGIGDQVYVGLLNTPYQNGTARTSTYDDFSVAASDACSEAQQAQSFPPGYQLCTEVLAERSFEQFFFTLPWERNDTVAVNLNPSGGNTGSKSLRAATFDGFARTPHFWQKFTMPDWVISSTTTFNLNFYSRVDAATQGNEPNDKFFAVVSTAPNTATAVTTPQQISQGVAEATWTAHGSQLNPSTGVNLESYKNQNLYAYFYNNSNAAACNGGGPCDTRFLFDDISLQVCTTQPKPSPINTRINGTVTLNFTNGEIEKLPGVRVWAYAENDPTIYETFSIQGGEFNFYNLPATASGTQYTIFAQHVLVDPNDPNQIETLSANSSIILKSTNGDANPAKTFLDLYSLAPLP